MNFYNRNTVEGSGPYKPPYLMMHELAIQCNVVILRQ